MARTPAVPIQKFKLPNGLRLLIKEDHRLPFVQLRAMLLGGVLAERPANNGVTQLMAKVLVKGSEHRTGHQIAEDIESVGGSIDAYGGNNSFGASIEVLSGDFALGLDVMADLLQRPSFPSEALDRQRTVQLAGLKAQQDKVLHSTFRHMRETMFGRLGYGLDSLGTDTSLGAMKRHDLVNFHKLHAIPNNCVLALYGDVKTDQARAQAEQAFGLWPRGEEPPAPRQPRPCEGQQRTVHQRDKEQAVVVLGYRGCTFRTPDRFALELIGEACSDLGSRLFLRIREELGLAYYVGAQSQPGLTPGFFTYYAGTAPQHVELVEAELLSEASKLAQEGLTEDELRRAKAKVIGQKKIARQDLGGLATMTGLDELYGLGFDANEREDEHLQAVTCADTQAAAVKYFNPNHSVVALSRPK